MTYLQLINAVLTRLREDTIEAGLVDSNPYYRSIGAHVNDAKDWVENSWQWSALRDTDLVPLLPSVGAQFPIPDTADNHTILKRFLVADTADIDAGYRGVRQVGVSRMRQLYANTDAVPQAKVTDVAVTGRDGEGNIAITVFPRPLDDGLGGSVETLLVDRVKHQGPLTDASQRILVPSLPVYSYATALASRERGELGGTPTSELFAIAETNLSNAIAQDSALYADELEWYSEGQRWHETNLRYT